MTMTVLEQRTGLLTGVGMGVGLMYLLDPDRGRRRRALLRDRLTHSTRVGAHAIGATSRDVSNRAAGAASQMRRVFKRKARQADQDASLQGSSTRPGTRPDILQSHWAPTTRLIVGSVGTALAGYGVTRRNLAGGMLAATGFGLLARAATNLDTRRLTGVGAGRRAVDVQKAITIDAPIEDVFAFWMEYENFPRFMSRVYEVRPGKSDRQSHWTVMGPAGSRVEFDAEISELVPNEVFGWRTVEGAIVAHSGLVRFDRVDDRRTRVQIRMSYNPPGGWFGHGVAAAFGVDPRRSLDVDLARMKTLLETRRAPRNAAQPVSDRDG
jgi:uncharacterized membrane protein